jgi:hypothetical protein
MPDYSIQEVGIQGYTEPGILNFITGVYYVKMMNTGTTDVEEHEFIEIGRALSKHLKQVNKWPEPLTYFPDEGKINLSDSYIAENFLGYEFLRSAFISSYKKDTTFKMFIIKTEDTDEVKRMLDRYIGMFKKDKIRIEGDFYFVQDVFNGNIVLSLKSRYLIGIFDTFDESIALEQLAKLRENIPLVKAQEIK